MPRIVLVSSIVAYGAYDKLVAADAQTPYSSKGATVTMPDGTIEAANVGATVKIGKPNAAGTDVDPIHIMLPGEVYPIHSHERNGVALRELAFKGSANNVVLYVNAP